MRELRHSPYTYATWLTPLIAIAIEIGKEVTRVYRRRQLRRELASLGVPHRPSSASVSDRGRSLMARPEVCALRPGESRDPPAARVLAFKETLAARGYIVDELSITKRVNYIDQ